ncbi:MAG: alpha-N-arabinofuranosidase [Bacteroidota bacterium]
MKEIVMITGPSLPAIAWITVPALIAGLVNIAEAGEKSTTHRLVVHADKGEHTISRHIYGHFTEHLGRCIYEGIWVGPESPIPNTRGIRNDVVAALKKIKVPNIRWPGGCFADEYHWKDGVGPREKRPSIINTHWGGVVENNHFGTHEFMDFCEQVGAEPFICGNVGSGTVQEMMEWVEYMTSGADSPMANLRRRNGRQEPWKLKYFAVGNENWGCGGNMRPEYYADVFRRYNTFIKNYSGNQVYRVACGAPGEDYNWTDVVMSMVGKRMNGISLHHYALPTGNWTGSKGSSTSFGEDQWFSTLKNSYLMEELVVKHSAVIEKYDQERSIGLIVDEWGTWYDVEPGSNPGFLHQQNTLRDAVTAAINLNIFNNHADHVKVANIAQMINVLQAMMLTDKERMIVTPTYHVFEMFTAHHDATLLPSDLSGDRYAFGDNTLPGVTASASRDQSGAIHITLCNLNPDLPAEVAGELRGAKAGTVSGRVLTAATMASHNTFDKPEAVRPGPFHDVRLVKGGFSATLPPKSVVVLKIQ